MAINTNRNNPVVSCVGAAVSRMELQICRYVHLDT